MTAPGDPMNDHIAPMPAEPAGFAVPVPELGYVGFPPPSR
jgi:hypothetical protein